MILFSEQKVASKRIFAIFKNILAVLQTSLVTQKSHEWRNTEVTKNSETENIELRNNDFGNSQMISFCNFIKFIVNIIF